MGAMRQRSAVADEDTIVPVLSLLASAALVLIVLLGPV